jgi:hypothetical protein
MPVDINTLRIADNYLFTVENKIDIDFSTGRVIIG